MPSLFGSTLIKAESDYRREIQRRFNQLDHDNRDTLRRRLAADYLFAHEHSSKRYQWFQNDKIYRENCRTSWKKEHDENGRTSHIRLPPIHSMQEKPLSPPNENDSPAVFDAKVKQKFLRNQPVLLEILHTQQFSPGLKQKLQLEQQKKSAQRRFRHIQHSCTDDPRYHQLVNSLYET